MPKKPTAEDLRNLLAPRPEPCLSLFLPLPRHGPELAKAPVRFRALVREAESLLEDRYEDRRVRALPAPLARPTIRFDLSWSILIAFAAVLCVLIVLPMSWLVLYSVSDRAGNFTLDNFIQLFTNPVFVTVGP